MSLIGKIVIVGAGLAGARAAEALRDEGYDGRITLLGEEPERPYLRPPLSKDYLRGESARESLQVHSEAFYVERQIDLSTSTRVDSIEPRSGRLDLSDGRHLRYDRLLLTTGARPPRLRVPGAGLAGVVSLRTLADADELRNAAADAEQVVVIGAGWVSTEVAASLRMLGRQVVLIAPNLVPLEHVLGPELGAVYHDLHAARGVEFRLGTSVGEIIGSDRVHGIETTDGERIAADLVVVGIGVEPRTELAAAAGIAVNHGVTVGATLETSIRGIFAAGDVASAWHPFYGRQVRSEHWANAKFQGIMAARTMLGRTGSYDRLPYFYSDQYDLNMEYTGSAGPSTQVVIRGSLEDRRFTAFWLDDGRVLAGMNANLWGSVAPIERLIRSRGVVDIDALTDPAIPIEELAALATV